MFDVLKKLFKKEEDIGISAKDKAVTILPPSPFTPDIAKLEKYALQLLFVCDEWMSDRRQSFVLEDVGARRYRETMFTQQGYDFRIHHGTDYRPDHAALPFLMGRQGLHIKGELFELHGSAFLLLDKLKQNGVQYRRRRVKLICVFNDRIVFENTTEDRRPVKYRNHGIMWDGRFPEGHPLAGKKEWVGPERICVIKAWMYEAIPSYWKQFSNPAEYEKVKTFTPRKTRKWLPEYFEYQNPKRE